MAEDSASKRPRPEEGAPAGKTVVSTDLAPPAVGPYSQANAFGGLVFVSGQLGVDPETKLMAEGVEAQARVALTNLKNVVEAAGSSMDKVLKCNLFLAGSMDAFAAVNAVYAEFFPTDFPARACVAVAALPLGGLFEIECVAHI
eukprot:CAMPEP_0198419638 /NCGR_PEP_ID=MMETSP1452-20131203/352_1 /TAXON_ID=1181717 /ORGANISM="Synchroma pusillum, Strain CCMP3072" /LENGTH=143 /DNA_ID=CAMNT_0044139773 /DNA_START=66 /DNA_END=497 /DNA_ORIENTATION=-